MFAVIALVVLAGFCSFAVDYGRVQAARAELQTAVDAAARYAATGVANGTAVTKAIDAANDNDADGAAINLSAGNVAVGNWNVSTRAFTAGGLPSNAVRVTASRRSADGNAVPLLFGAMVGKSTCDVSATSIALAPTTGTQYALIGLDEITLSGNAGTDSYSSNNGAYNSASAGSKGSLASNGNITMSGNANVRGDARPGVGRQVNLSGNASVSGSKSPLTSPLSYPPPALPGSYTEGGAFSKSGNGSTTITAGVYHYTSFSVSGNHSLVISGEVSIYVSGAISLSGNVSVNNSQPGNFKVRGLSNANVNISGNGSLYADVYAPLSDLSISGNGDFYGRFVGRKITMSGNGKIHYDEAIAPLGGGGGGSGAIVLVN